MRPFESTLRAYSVYFIAQKISNDLALPKNDPNTEWVGFSKKHLDFARHPPANLFQWTLFTILLLFAETDDCK